MRLGLLGRAIAHSPSPALHGWALGQAGITGSYALFDCADADAAWQAVARLRAGELDGLNVTQPWKTYLAQRLGLAVPTVNTLWRDADGRVAGASTDGIGLLDVIGKDLCGGRWLVVGTGGAATSVALTVAERGLPLAIMGRDPARVQAVAGLVAARNPACAVAALPWGGPRDDVTVVVHATSLGHGGVSDLATATALDGLPWSTWLRARLWDLVYASNGPTAFEACAQRRGLAGLQPGAGRAVLCAQACRSFQLWTGRHCDWRAMHRAVFYQEYISAPVGSG